MTSFLTEDYVRPDGVHGVPELRVVVVVEAAEEADVAAVVLVVGAVDVVVAVGAAALRRTQVLPKRGGRDRSWRTGLRRPGAPAAAIHRATATGAGT